MLDSLDYWCKDCEKAHESMFLSLQKHRVAGKLKTHSADHRRKEMINKQCIVYIINQ